MLEKLFKLRTDPVSTPMQATLFLEFLFNGDLLDESFLYNNFKFWFDFVNLKNLFRFGVANFFLMR